MEHIKIIVKIHVMTPGILSF